MDAQGMGRREFMGYAAAAAADFGLGGAAFAAGDARPNIMVIIADDLGDGDLGCYGNPAIATPHLDRLAEQGVRFTSAFVTTSSCSPSRTSFFTGMYPHATGAEDLHVPLPSGIDIIPSYLSRAGYHTMHAGKLHLGPEGARQFDRVDTGRIDTDASIWERMLDERPADRPFFMTVCFYDPHRPYGPGASEPPTDPASVIVPPYLADTPDTRRDIALYYDAARRLDRNAGAVMGKLEREGLDRDTVVIFFSDNGMPFPRAKTSCHDSGVRTPMIVRWPGVAPEGAVSGSLMSTVDLAPTILAMAGVDAPQSMQGVDAGPVFRDPEATVREYVHVERNWHNIDDHQRGVRDGRYKYIRQYHPRRPMPLASDLMGSPSYDALLRERDAGRLTAEQMRLFMVPRAGEELYDTARDPWEFVNIAGNPSYAGVLERLRAECDRWLENTHDSPLSSRRKDNLDIFTREKYGKTSGEPELWMDE